MNCSEPTIRAFASRITFLLIFRTALRCATIWLLAVGVAVAEVFAPAILGWFFPKFTPSQLELCVHLTRILLPEDWVGYPLRKDYNIRLQDVEWVRKHLGIDSGQKYYVGEARAAEDEGYVTPSD